MGMIAKILGVGTLVGGGLAAYYYREDIIEFIRQLFPVPPPPPPPECLPVGQWKTEKECITCGGYWYGDACHSAPKPPCTYYGQKYNDIDLLFLLTYKGWCLYRSTPTNDLFVIARCPKTGDEFTTQCPNCDLDGHIDAAKKEADTRGRCE